MIYDFIRVADDNVKSFPIGGLVFVSVSCQQVEVASALNVIQILSHRQKRGERRVDEERSHTGQYPVDASGEKPAHAIADNINAHRVFRILSKIKTHNAQQAFQYTVRVFAFVTKRRRVDIMARDVFTKPFVFRIVALSTEPVNVDNQPDPSFGRAQ
jgi:hypothetical protein